MRHKNLNQPDSLKGVLKRLWDGMRSGEFVSFRVSIKARKDAERVKELSIDGEWSGNGQWDFHFPKNSDATPAESAEVLKQRLAQIDQSVRDYLVENGLENDWNSASADERIKEGVLSKRSIDDYLCSSDIPRLAFSQSGYDAHFAAPTLAIACAIAGAAALDRNDLGYASYCADLGLCWIHEKMLIPNPGDRYKSRAGMGGNEKALRYKPVKDKVAELLEILAPDDGWETLSKAIVRVAIELTEKHSEFVEECGLQCHALVDTIPGWIDKDPARFPCRIKPRARYNR
ncbi:Uncharacterised protein [Burkholderia pseudomallei]|nr:hypothetical protein X961_1969 [Burkholderia pseudomallei MSHR5613]CAJ8144015.1 Uncharacterised protein [Burkholderia pseudomallei]CAJ8193090.1 Uncharacterised protein [Burkholderia pseudomallei]CAJ8933016.1 Uncharacterised protein [Burkholderia pseudomallei]